jgi:hypothetical protein
VRYRLNSLFLSWASYSTLPKAAHFITTKTAKVAAIITHSGTNIAEEERKRESIKLTSRHERNLNKKHNNLSCINPAPAIAASLA